MEAFAIDKLIYDIGDEMDGWQHFKANPQELLARHRDVTPDQLEAVLSGDAKRLYEWGVNGYLLLRYCHWLNMDPRALMQLVQGQPAAAGAR